MGLLASDKDHHECLLEAAAFKTAHALRILFVTILIHSDLADARKLLDQHCNNLFEDCAYRLRQDPYRVVHPSEAQVRGLGLLLIAQLVEQHGRTMQELGLPDPPPEMESLHLSSLLQEEMSYPEDDLQNLARTGSQQANPGQRAAIMAVRASVAGKLGHIFFLDGPGGTGKTFVEKVCLAEVRLRKGIALAVASSGVASLLLPGGRTAHSRFKIPIGLGPDSVCSVSSQSALAELFRQTELVVWDEAVMQHNYCFAAVDRMLQDVRQCNRLFGGLTVLFAGEPRPAT